MNRSIVRAFALAALALLFASPARAFISNTTDASQPLRWNLTALPAAVHTNVVNRASRAVRYFLAANAYSSANRAAELNAARACFDQWQAVPNSLLRFEEGGVMPGAVDVNTADNTNVVFWAKDSPIVGGGRINISGILALTNWDLFSDGTLAEADIVLNGAGFTWFTDFQDTINQGVFVEAVLLHEIGHFIGLAHSPIGAATMYPRGGNGLSTQAGLSVDDIAAVHTLYPAAPAFSSSLGAIAGLVTMQGAPVLGAIVIAEDAAGNIAAGTATRANGAYQLPALRPATYQVRVTPADPRNASYFLFRGSDISANYTAAEPNFLPTSNAPVTVAAGSTAPFNAAVTPGAPPLRIGRLMPPTTSPEPFVIVNYPSFLSSSDTDLVLGVYSSDLPASNVILSVTGNGLTVGPTSHKTNIFPGANPPLHVIYAPVHISADATPGLRSLIVRQDTALAYANGFLEIPSQFADHNFDGLDDAFQRQYFELWTSPNAAPAADPDGDGFTNHSEFLAGSNPADSRSVLTVESVRYDTAGATVTWPSAPGRKYQVLSRPNINSIRGWQPLGSPVVATSDKSQFTDTTPSTATRFYRVQAIEN